VAGGETTNVVSASVADHALLGGIFCLFPLSKPKRLKILDEYEDKNCDGGVLMTVTQYLFSNEKPTNEKQANPLLFSQNSKYIVLASLARTYLTGSALSVPCEAIFLSLV